MAEGDLTYVNQDGIMLGTSATTIYTVPSDRHIISLEIIFCNVTAAAQEVKAYMVPSGASASTTNAFILQDASTALTDGESRAWASNQFLTAGYIISALNNNGTSVNAKFSCVLRHTA